MARHNYNLALVLGGGGARGLAHVGVLKVLLKAGIKFDLVVGTSMGSIVGAMFARTLDIDLVEERIVSLIDRYGEKAKWVKFLGESRNKNGRSMLRDISYYVKWHLAGLKSLGKISLEERDVLLSPLREFFGDATIEDCRMAYAAVALDLCGGAQKVLTTGPIVDAVYASSAIQGVFPPLEYDGQLLCDGGPVAIVPVEIARDLGARRVIAVDVWGEIRPETEFSNALQVIFRADSVSLDRVRRTDLALADVVISPDVREVHWANLDKARDCIAQGEAAAEQALPSITELAAPRPWWKRVFKRD